MTLKDGIQPIKITAFQTAGDRFEPHHRTTTLFDIPQLDVTTLLELQCFNNKEIKS